MDLLSRQVALRVVVSSSCGPVIPHICQNRHHQIPLRRSPRCCIAVPSITRDHVTSDYDQIRRFVVQNVSNDLLVTLIPLISLAKVQISELNHSEFAFSVEFELLG